MPRASPSWPRIIAATGKRRRTCLNSASGAKGSAGQHASTISRGCGGRSARSFGDFPFFCWVIRWDRSSPSRGRRKAGAIMPASFSAAVILRNAGWRGWAVDWRAWNGCDSVRADAARSFALSPSIPSIAASRPRGRSSTGCRATMTKWTVTFSDPRCGFAPSVQIWIELLQALAAGLPTPAPSLPVRIIAGEFDPVCSPDPGAIRLEAHLRQAGVRRVDRKVYPGARHELFHETNRAEVVRDLIEWLDQILAGSSGSFG